MRAALVTKSIRIAGLFIMLAGFPVVAHANTVIDLTTQNSTSGVLSSDNGVNFIVTEIDAQSTGTGFVDSFLRIQQNGDENGYNTDDLSPPPLDSKAGNFTHAITLAEVPTVTIGLDTYRQFILDINQNGTELLSLTQLQIFLSPSDPGNSGFTLIEADNSPNTFAEISFPGATEVFQMSSTAAGKDYELKLNYALNSGSGSGDYLISIAASAFTGAGTQNLILFAQFGDPNGAQGSNDGFEEFWVACPQGSTNCFPGSSTGEDPVPEPATLLLFGTGLVATAYRARRKNRN
jgi:hypothetical protein